MSRRLRVVRERTVAMKDRICRTPGCGSKCISRDVCPACYMAAYRLLGKEMEAGKEITFEVLEDSGTLSRAREGTRKEWFLSKLQKIS